jgi:dTDP-4-dehydrorhamnose reductase
MEKKPVILVTGAKGQVGLELKDASASFPQFDFIFLSREDLSLDNPEQVRSRFRQYQPQYCINCAAYTAVDKAETDQAAAYTINSEAVGILAGICKENNAFFLHLSTDYVFNGLATAPYKENGITEPHSIYGSSKLEGEKLAILYNPRTIIIRTSWVYSLRGKNFVKTMLRLMAEQPEISVVNDQTGSPTWAHDLAIAILHIIDSGKWKPGTYHYSNDGAITWYDFANAIKEISGSNCTIRPIPTAGYATPAKRPVYSVLDTSKIQEEYDVKIKFWRDSLIECLGKL